MSVQRVPALALVTVLVFFHGATRAADDDLSMADARTIAAYPLTMNKVQRKYAVAADLARLSATDKTLQSQL